MPCRVAFLGSPAFAVPSLRAVAAHHQVAWVLTQPDRPAGRGRKEQPTAVRQAALDLGLAVATYVPRQRREIEARLRQLDLDALVVVAFGHILRPSTLETARCGAVNVHASLLPRWRGVAPIERALWAGDAETGVTLMAIDAGVDTGDMLARTVVRIEPHDTRITLTGKLAQAGAAILQAELGRFVAGQLQPQPQPESGATYAPKLEKSDGRLDWSNPVEHLDRQVRALVGWPGTSTELHGTVLKVHAVRVCRTAQARPASASPVVPGTVVQADAKRGVVVACGDGALELLEVQLAGRPRVEAAALVRGRQLQAGDRLGRLEETA